MENIENTSAGKLMSAIFGDKASNLYPYIIEDGDGHHKMVSLKKAVEEALDALPEENWRRALDLLFGLSDGKPRTRKEVGQELNNVTRERIRQIEAKSLYLLKRPSISMRLRSFIVPSPEEIYNLRREQKRLRQENSTLKESNQKFQDLLKAWGAKEEDFERFGPDELFARLKTSKEDWDEFEALTKKFPNNRVWNAIRRVAHYYPKIIKPSVLKEVLLTGEIYKLKKAGKIRRFDKAGIAFLKQVFQELEKEASP